MDTRAAIDTMQAVIPREEQEAAFNFETLAATLLAAFRVRLKNDEEYELSDGEAAAAFHLCATMRESADRIERDLLRHLKWGGEGMTWQQVAEAVDSQIGGRQAMQKRWARLTDDRRRTTTGDMRRGRAAQRRSGAGVDTTTQEA